MTNKEKLRLLYFNGVLHNDDPNFIIEQTSYLDDLIKDLEVLDIFKKHIQFNDYCFNDKDQNCIDILIPESDDDYKVIKEWLEK